MSAETIARALGGRGTGHDWMARCPAHQDSRPSLSIADADDGRVLLHCHAGCSQDRVIAALADRHLWADQHTKSVRPTSRKIRAAIATIDPYEVKRTEAASAIWNQTVPSVGTPVQTYLRSRDLVGVTPPSIRFHPGLKHREGGIWPTIVAAVTRGAENAHSGIHRTYLMRDGNGKAPIEGAKMMLGPCAGGAVRLTESEGPLVVCGGIETGLSLLSGLLSNPAKVWAALSTSGMKALQLPVETGQLTVAADGDNPGREAANVLAERAHALGWQVSLLPAPEGHDWNDVL